MVAIEHIRKVAVIEFDTNVVKGSHVTAFAAKPDDAVVIEKKTVPNIGHVSFAFPMHFTGDVYFEFQGSRGGDPDTGVVHIP